MKKYFVVCSLIVFLPFCQPNDGICLEAGGTEGGAGGEIAESRSPTSSELSDPTNQAITKALKNKALKEHEPEAMLPLINLGDSDVIKESVVDLDDRMVRRQTEQMLQKCAQPKVIGALGDYLNLTESAEIIIVYDVGVLPKSVIVGRIIQAILRNSQAFSPDVKRWAAGSLGFKSSLLDKGEFRRQMRAWWKENRSLILSERYNEVKPPSDWNGRTN